MPTSAPIRDTELGKKMWDVYISCLNNLSACHISSGDFAKAKEVCIKVLESEDTNIKALLEEPEHPWRYFCSKSVKRVSHEFCSWSPTTSSHYLSA